MNVPTIINTQNNRNESSRVVKEKFFDFSREKKKSFYQHFVRASFEKK